MTKKAPSAPAETPTPPTSDAIRTSLLASMDQAEWGWIIKHAERDVVIIVQPKLDLVDVGVQIALDHAQVVADWIAEKAIAKPTRQQLDGWDAQPTKKFMTLVVQPYVLVQELLH